MMTVEAIYENGIFKPISRVPESLKENERVRIIIENDAENLRVSDELLREMLAEGLISHIPEGITDAEDDFEPVKIKDKPLSETILEDRN
ncbi:MAG TPA: antitoxin family protein [Pyrinomonadaceae bacterium]|jgi:predicted DNA-binding antitoxin AbrB/MazE fold protein